MPPSTQRLQQIATMYSSHHDQLRAVVYRRGSQNLQVVEDACSHAWTQLLATEQIDVRPPRCVALGWVTTTVGCAQLGGTVGGAVRHAWMLGQTQRRAKPTVLPEIDKCITEHGNTAPASDELAAQHLRLDLVTRIPERPRRFLAAPRAGLQLRRDRRRRARQRDDDQQADRARQTHPARPRTKPSAARRTVRAHALKGASTRSPPTHQRRPVALAARQRLAG
jgi:hypothetical protein